MTTAGKRTAGKKTAGTKAAGKKAVGRKVAGEKVAGERVADRKVAGTKPADRKAVNGKAGDGRTVRKIAANGTAVRKRASGGSVAGGKLVGRIVAEGAVVREQVGKEQVVKERAAKKVVGKRRRKGTRESILAAARELLHEGGKEAVGMRPVAERVGVTPMAIYRHFPDRESLLQGVADEGFRELAGQMRAVKLEGGYQYQLMRMGRVFVDAALRSPALYELMFLAPRKGARVYPDDFEAGRSPTFEPTVKILKRAMREGELRKDNAVEIAFELSAIVHGLIVLYLGGRVGRDEADFRSLYQRSFWRYFDGLRG